MVMWHMKPNTASASICTTWPLSCSNLVINTGCVLPGEMSKIKHCNLNSTYQTEIFRLEHLILNFYSFFREFSVVVTVILKISKIVFFPGPNLRSVYVRQVLHTEWHLQPMCIFTFYPILVHVFSPNWFLQKINLLEVVSCFEIFFLLEKKNGTVMASRKM